jgi:hypothetical protein
MRGVVVNAGLIIPRVPAVEVVVFEVICDGVVCVVSIDDEVTVFIADMGEALMVWAFKL